MGQNQGNAATLVWTVRRRERTRGKKVSGKEVTWEGGSIGRRTPVMVVPGRRNP